MTIIEVDLHLASSLSGFQNCDNSYDNNFETYAIQNTNKQKSDQLFIHMETFFMHKEMILFYLEEPGKDYKKSC